MVCFYLRITLLFQIKFILFKLLVVQSSDQSSTIQDWLKLTALAIDLLDTLGNIDPGASRNRGKILKDLIKPFMKIAEFELAEQKIDSETFAKRKNMAKDFAKDLIMCYKYENMKLNWNDINITILLSYLYSKLTLKQNALIN